MSSSASAEVHVSHETVPITKAPRIDTRGYNTPAESGFCYPMPKIQSTSCGPLVTRSFRSIYYIITACSETSIDTQLAVHVDPGSAQRINGRCISDFHQTTDCILNDKHGHRHIISVNIISWLSLPWTTNYHPAEIAIMRTKTPSNHYIDGQTISRNSTGSFRRRPSPDTLQVLLLSTSHILICFCTTWMGQSQRRI